ncbi:MAG: pfkB family carbohydrate kinase [bacterium ADurb.Bin236]|nr:MAG: pfkB family carbohydrate kinase [bacterium ADurb.Bin236]HPN93479.1 PfkB family carbohydrate kinase [bacterium]
MSQQTERELVARLKNNISSNANAPGKMRCVVGLDGFIDEIVHVVDTRKNNSEYARLEMMSDYAERIKSYAGKSGNIEYVPQRVKIGGNGPIMANAIASLGVSTTYIGTLGRPDIHPVFRPLKDAANVISIAEPCHTDAVEFLDGKIMVGKMAPVSHVTWDRILEDVGKERFVNLLDEARLLALVNWSMLPFMSDIWENIISEIFPKLSTTADRFFFIDLADPQKRELSDIKRMLSIVPKFSRLYKVILGLNGREAGQIASALGLAADASGPDAAARACEEISRALGVFSVVVHPVEFAVTVVGGKTYHQDGPHTKRPVITTGAGDHFNAAFSLALSLGADPQTALLMGVCCSGHYVMTGETPDMDKLLSFMSDWRDDPFGKM